MYKCGRKGENRVTCLDVEKKGAVMASGSHAEAPMTSSVNAAPPMREAITVGQIRLKAVSSKTLFLLDFTASAKQPWSCYPKWLVCQHC